MYAILALAGLIALSSNGGQATTQARFEAIAGSLPIFPDPGDFVYDRGLESLDPLPKEWLAAWAKADAEIHSRQHAVADLIALLKHRNAGVRTLALAALCTREDAHLLPHIYTLVKDEARSFPCPDRLTARIGIPQQPAGPPALRHFTVGRLASLCLRFWLEDVNCPEQDFPDYWKARQHRKQCVSWFGARLRRATQGISPFRKDRAERVRALRKEIDRLPAPDRDWTLLWLAAHGGGQVNEWQDKLLASPAELVQAAKRLGHQQLLRFMNGEAVSDDPDLQTGKCTVERHSLTFFILAHANELLQREDVPFLLTLEEKHSSPWPARAVARLDPEKAKQHLQEAMQRMAVSALPGTGLTWQRSCGVLWVRRRFPGWWTGSTRKKSIRTRTPRRWRYFWMT
jgi:hypothetical protein